MTLHAGRLLLVLVMVVVAWAESLRRRSDRTQSYWVLLVIGTLMSGVGELIWPGKPLAHGLQLLASGALTVIGMSLLAGVVVGGICSNRPAIGDASFLRECKRAVIVLALGSLGLFLLFILFAVSFPSLLAPASYFVGGPLRAVLYLPFCIYLPVLILWLLWMRRRLFTMDILRSGRFVVSVGLVAVVASFVFLALHVSRLVAIGSHPYPGVIAAYVSVGILALIETLIVLCSYRLAVWGLAAGA